MSYRNQLGAKELAAEVIPARTHDFISAAQNMGSLITKYTMESTNLMFIVWRGKTPNWRTSLNGKEADIGAQLSPPLKQLGFNHFLSGFKKKCLIKVRLCDASWYWIDWRIFVEDHYQPFRGKP